MKKIFLPLFFFCSFLFAQEENGSTISGFVFDHQTGEALIGANVYLDGLPLGSGTNNSGYYVITNVPAGKQKLIASFLGYKNFSKMIVIGTGQDVKLNVVLKPDLLETETIFGTN